MTELKTQRWFTLAAIAVIAYACSETSGIVSPLTPPPSTRGVQFTAAPAGKGLATHAVNWGAGHSSGQYSVSAVITAAGGTISLPNSDFTITFARGALSSKVTITVVSLGGPWIAYDLLPHGLKFSKPVVVTQGLLTTSAAVAGFTQPLYAAYLPDGYEAISRNGEALAAEIESSTTNLSLTGVPVSQVWYLNHFSRYILASGDTQPLGETIDPSM